MPTRNIPVIAVTGSAGKTTTKEMIASILRRRWTIFKSASNWNLPLNTRKHAKQLRAGHRAAVLEFGMLRKGHIREHCRSLKPSYGVITNVGTAHIGNVGHRVQGIASAKSELIRHMRQTGTLVLNADNANSKLLSVKGFQGRLLKVGIRNKAHYKAYGIRFLGRGVAFRVRLNGKEERFFIPCLGVHNVYNALNAIAITHSMGFTASEIRKGLAKYPIPYRRLVRTELPGRITLIDDTFSSNPDATKAALDTLASVSRKHKIAIIGYMKDMGKYAVRGHDEVGKYAARNRLTRLYTVGKLARHIAAGARKAGFPATRIRSFASRPQLERALAGTIKPGTAILVKGTHLLKLEKTVSFLKRSLSRKRS
ncbi:UDP-N-acetylmuramoyl-tripeptide--D-alanyl-D-alanine ligase [Paenibacillus elgii]|uniref:UDP-N-acetylmuramoyl-tripeptide--D-alanyl-D- alanine ligase n=1 Tax=Paenibacillus elgii TaxID=189691 RepID=UPI000248CB3D|nr:UDP-N-acetylmuramoyl-tripeptide--D-alanyl-D-alanine ligase [Paenibacillus elgii]